MVFSQYRLQRLKLNDDAGALAMPELLMVSYHSHTVFRCMGSDGEEPQTLLNSLVIFISTKGDRGGHI